MGEIGIDIIYKNCEKQNREMAFLEITRGRSRNSGLGAK